MPAHIERKPQRTCIGCRKRNDQDRFLRVFRGAGGRVLVYEGGTLTGRSAYVCPNHSCIEQAMMKEKLGRALKQSVTEEAKVELNTSLLSKLR